LLRPAAGAIRAIAEVSAKVKMLVDEVNLGSQEQARGIDQVSRPFHRWNGSRKARQPMLKKAPPPPKS
jgi:hypothetical protein